MNRLMKAVVYHAPKDVRVEQVPLPRCGPDEIRAKVDACAVCGSDLKAYLHGNPRLKAPITMGHEFTAVVETVGPQVQGFSLGERIVMATSVSCGECFYCRRGWTNLCAELSPMGFTYPGGMAEYVIIPGLALRRGHVVKVPAGVQPEHAALSEPLSCCVNAAESCDIREGDVVVVVGAGPMGIMNACVARQFKAGKIVVAEVNPERLKQADGLGFERLVNPACDDLAAVVKQETGGIGADAVIVAAPAAAPQEQAPALARRRGTICLFASLPAGRSSITLDSRIVHYGEQRVIGVSDSTPTHVKKAVELISRGAMPMGRLASHKLPLDEVFRAYELMERGEALRVVLCP